MNEKSVQIIIAGVPASGKTVLASAIAQLCYDHGITVSVHDADPMVNGLDQHLNSMAGHTSVNITVQSLSRKPEGHQ